MNCLDIFYNEIILEAANGRIDCFFMYNILFETKVIEDNIHIKSNQDLIIPTLIINNKTEFNRLLLEYVELAKNFYDLTKLQNELNSPDNINNIPIEKTIMTLLWANATIEDFNDPIIFLRKRIAFFKDTSLLKYQNVNLGFSKILNSDAIVSIKKDTINNETPYTIKIKLIDKDSENAFYFPDIRVGIDHNTAYIYAIQNNKQEINDNPFAKKINRLLFKIGENFIDDGSSDLKDITSSFVISSNIVLRILEDIGIKTVLIPTILISRWNSKLITDQTKNTDNEESYIKIQKNLTDKFIRIFRRIAYHNQNIQIDSYPFELDSYLHLSFNKNLNYINNQLLDETYNFKHK